MSDPKEEQRMTLYRINPDADDRDVFHALSTDPGEEPPMIPVEPTDRICLVHDTIHYGQGGSDVCWRAEDYTDPSPCSFLQAVVYSGEPA